MPLREFVSAGGELIIQGAAHLKNSPIPDLIYKENIKNPKLIIPHGFNRPVNRIGVGLPGILFDDPPLIVDPKSIPKR
jgi:hypothetical protein